MKITFFGTTTLLFDDGRDQFLFDAYLTRASLIRAFLGKVETDRAVVDRIVKEYAIDRLRGIFVSHSHIDHVLDAAYIAAKTGAVIYGSPSVANVALGGGIPEEKILRFAVGETHAAGDFAVKVLPARHSRPFFFSNDLDVPIEAPLHTPARACDFHEGGSHDFLVQHGDKRYLIHPSCHFIPGALDGAEAEVLFLAIGGLSRMKKAERAAFFAETLGKVKPKIAVPLHWDNFYRPLTKPIKGLPKIAENSELSLAEFYAACAAYGCQATVLTPIRQIECP